MVKKSNYVVLGHLTATFLTKVDSKIELQKQIKKRRSKVRGLA
jgi:hypothetical protein